MKKRICSLFCMAAIFSVSLLYASKDTVYVADTYATHQEGTLNDSVNAVIARGTLSNTVFKLDPWGLYVLTGAIVTPTGATLEIVAPEAGSTQESAPPMICYTASSSTDKTYWINCPGTVIMKNIWMLAAGVDSTQTQSCIRVGDSASTTGGHCQFENMIFDYVPCPVNASGAIEVYATHFIGHFKNCYFRNCIDPHLRYYGRALSFPYNSQGLHSDSVSFENCTFANIGYVYMQEGAEYADNVKFNHCTFHNVVVFCFEHGWWYKMSVTNCLFNNVFMFGATPANDGEGSGIIEVIPVDSLGFKVSWTNQDRRILIANNDYFMPQWFVDWMGWGPNGNPYSKGQHSQRLDDMIPIPQPWMNSQTKAFFDSIDATSGNKAYPYINEANTYIGSDPGFKIPPTNVDSLKQFLYKKWSDNSNCNWGYNLHDDFTQAWPMKEDLSYTNDTIISAGMTGLPLGDLYHWWPTQYATWKAKADAENARIETWLSTGKDPGTTSVKQQSVLPGKFDLSQNYPNPFNPTTQIKYSVPSAGTVSLKVYNTLGQEVATLFDGIQKAGNYVATFNGAGFASGVYLYKLQSGNISLTKKFVLIK